jgi:predicted DNA-binding antitoxin AbrB/MazE fold protein
MIRAVYRNGVIQPLDSLPADWREGLVLEVSESDVDADVRPTAEEVEEWSAAVLAATAGITDEEHAQFLKALDEIEAESKELGRREMERSP